MGYLRCSFAVLGYWRMLVAFSGLLTSVSLFAQVQQTDDAGRFFLERPDSAKFAVIIAGPTVGDENLSRFREWSFSLHDILIRDYGYNSDSISLLMDLTDGQPADISRVDGISNRADIEKHFALLKQKVRDGDQISIFLIGHGSGSEAEAKFNIVGPDITGVEFATLLDQFDEQNLVIVNTTSASYGFSESLSSEGRVLISATRSPSEKYDPIFSRFFIEALDQRNGDRDKNNRVSMLEAFNYARQNVDQWYEDQGRLASEHASLDDNGDALFTLNPTPNEQDGRLAEIAYMDVLGRSDSQLSPEALARQARMQELERAVFILRGRKSDYLEQDYWRQMETLLVDLARATEQYDEIQ